MTNETDYWLRLVSLPFRAYVICAPIIVFSLDVQLSAHDSLIFDSSIANIGWADIGCLFVLSGIAWVAFWINARKMLRRILIYVVIGLVLSSVFLPLTVTSRYASLRFKGIIECIGQEYCNRTYCHHIGPKDFLQPDIPGASCSSLKMRAPLRPSKT